MLISVIVTSLGSRTALLQETVASALEAVSAFADAELIVVRHSGKDAPLPRHDRLTLIDDPARNVSYGRNLGARHAQGTYLLFIDDDMLLRTENLERLKAATEGLGTQFLLNLSWIHSPAVAELKAGQAFGQLFLRMNPHDSFEKRYRNLHGQSDWTAGRVFQSAFTTEFSEACFAMNRLAFLASGGFDERFSFGGEGAEFMGRLLQQGYHYYIDPQNIILHNETDKFTDWHLELSRAAGSARNENAGRTSRQHTAYSYKAKLWYGVLLHARKGRLLRRIGRKMQAEPAGVDFVSLEKEYGELIAVYYWNALHWSTIRRNFRG